MYRRSNPLRGCMNSNWHNAAQWNDGQTSGLNLIDYNELRNLYAQPGANFGYNIHDLPSIAPFPERSVFRHSAHRLDEATRAGDTILDEIYASEGRGAALRFAREDALNPPEWIDLDRVHRGQRLGRRYFSCLAVTLGNLSLIGGFGASKINRVLVRGSRLSKSSAGRGYDPLPRLVETASWLLDALRSVEFGSRGFEETVKVRALHSMIRSHLLDMSWDSDTLDYPINQEQMLSTLMGFSYNGVWGLRRMGIRVTAREAEDYIHLWAYIGHMLGIDADFLPQSFEDARATTIQLVPRILAPDDETRKIIRNLHERRLSRLGLPHSIQSAMCRFFLPHPYADELGLHGNLLVDAGVGLLYRGVGRTVSTVGRFRPHALEQWEIQRVSQRLETVLATLREKTVEDTRPQSPVRRRLGMLRELSRAIISV